MLAEILTTNGAVARIAVILGCVFCAALFWVFISRKE